MNIKTINLLALLALSFLSAATSCSIKRYVDPEITLLFEDYRIEHKKAFANYIFETHRILVIITVAGTDYTRPAELTELPALTSKCNDLARTLANTIEAKIMIAHISLQHKFSVALQEELDALSNKQELINTLRLPCTNSLYSEQ